MSVDRMMSVTDAVLELAAKHGEDRERCAMFLGAVSNTLGMICAAWAVDDVARLNLVDFCRAEIRIAAFSDRAANLAKEVAET